MPGVLVKCDDVDLDRVLFVSRPIPVAQFDGGQREVAHALSRTLYVQLTNQLLERVSLVPVQSRERQIDRLR
ncbi:hypothetical protein D3C87_1996770 [compost metagenome]